MANIPRTEYQRLAKDEDGQACSELGNEEHTARNDLIHRFRLVVAALVVLLSVGAGWLAGVTWMSLNNPGRLSSTAPQIPVPYVQGEFVYSSPFSLEPPQGEGSGEESEPIWDALVPSKLRLPVGVMDLVGFWAYPPADNRPIRLDGLGYFRDGHLAPNVSIPTTFHQLHCLYVLRRAYYSTQSGDRLESFDLGKDRVKHAAHCFDYLKQTITCSVDSTIEPYEGDAETDGFLGSGFLRQCRSFDTLKEYVERWRVFNATGFLAAGIEHGKAHVHTDR